MLSQILASMTMAALAAASTGSPVVDKVARGHSWVSPYWGYNTPKIVWDGNAFYTAGLWGAFGEASGVVYKHTDTGWQPGTSLPDIYQPATLVLDSAGRLIVAHTRSGQPIRLLRARAPGTIADFDELDPPPDMAKAYYIGVAIRDEVLYLAYLVDETYSMYLTQLDLASMTWAPSSLVQEGQVATKPKTAWTYPILFPTETGLHLVASNSPDGGDGNTYNQVWHLFFPSDGAPAVRELVAGCPMGHNAYAMDMTVAADDTVHILFMWNRHVYGATLPEGSPPGGNYHAWREPATGRWRRGQIDLEGILGLYNDGGSVRAIGQRDGALATFEWAPGEQRWIGEFILCPIDTLPAGPSFLDVISLSSGSKAPEGIALVSDGLLPERADEVRERVVWSLLPKPSLR
ncbi:MAG: hypothetical protein GY851_03250 [bacterium]|nr:hypothetical protein [bacterium]